MHALISLFAQQPINRERYIQQLGVFTGLLVLSFLTYYGTLLAQFHTRMEPSVFHYGIEMITGLLTLVSWMGVAFLGGNILLGRLQYLNRSEIWILPLCLLAVNSAPWGLFAVSIILSLDQLKGPSLSEMMDNLPQQSVN